MMRIKQNNLIVGCAITVSVLLGLPDDFAWAYLRRNPLDVTIPRPHVIPDHLGVIPYRSPVAILVPAFSSDPPPLGLSVATILNLQIWQTLRKEAENDPTGSSFGGGAVLWDADALEQPTHEAAAREATKAGAQLILWGKAYRYGSGYAVPSYLTIPDDARTGNQLWKLKIDKNGTNHSVVSDVPSRRYSFEPIALSKDIVEAFSSADALKLYRTPDRKNLIGSVSPKGFTALEQNDGKVRVRSNDVEGWILLPQLANTRPEIVDFVGGVMRVFRADWRGAIGLLSHTAENQRAPVQIRIDSYLYMARASYELHSEFESYLKRAEDLNPYASRVVRYRVMGMLAKLQDADGNEKMQIALQARSYLRAHASLFSPSDNWVSAADATIEAFL